MLATKNRTEVRIGIILAMAVLMTACTPPGPRALIKGKKLLDAGNYDAAALELETATSLMATNASAWNYLGLAYHRAGQGSNAAVAYTRALKLNRDLLEARFNLGCLWLEENKLDAAKSEFTAYTLRRGNVPDGWFKLGLAQLRATNSMAAEKSFREAINLNPKSAEALNGLGLAQLQRGRAADAVQSFSAALKQQPDYPPALLNLATVLQQDQSSRSEALRRYREYLALEPRAADWEAVNLVAQSLTPPAAVQPRLVTNVVSRNMAATNATKPATTTTSRPTTPPKPTANQNATKPSPLVFGTPPLPPQAAGEVVKLPLEPVVKKVVEGSQNNVASKPVTMPTHPAGVPSPTAERRGLSSFTQETKSSGNDSLMSAPATNASPGVIVPEGDPVAGGRYVYQSPAIPQAGDRLAAEWSLVAGQQAQKIGRLSEAIQAYRRAGQLDGSYFEAHYRLGLTAFEMRSFRLALAAWETALALRPDSADARYNFALTLKASNYPNDAANEWEKMLALHPDEARGHLTLGNLYAEQLRDIPRARRHYGRVLQLDPRNPQAQAIRYWLVANPG